MDKWEEGAYNIPMSVQLKIISYNLHKGRTIYGKKIAFDTLKQFLDKEHFDIGLFQEVLGYHQYNGDIQHQIEQLADTKWQEYSFARNSVVANHDHGNSILSKYPILEDKILNLTLHELEKRSAILTKIDIGPIHLNVICTHLNLFQKHRMKQAEMVLDFIEQNIDPSEPIILGGDFNDWNGKITSLLVNKGGFSSLPETFKVKTFPSFMPLLSLDRILIKNLHLVETSRGSIRDYRRYSDHLPVFYTIDYSPQ